MLNLEIKTINIFIYVQNRFTDENKYNEQFIPLFYYQRMSFIEFEKITFDLMM
jgi:hypothetical protein